jgi:hypothetical protein
MREVFAGALLLFAAAGWSFLMVEYVITKPGLKYTKKLLNVTWDEPNSDLFNPPSDYEIPPDGPVEAPRP